MLELANRAFANIPESDDADRTEYKSALLATVNHCIGVAGSLEQRNDELINLGGLALVQLLHLAPGIETVSEHPESLEGLQTRRSEYDLARTRQNHDAADRIRQEFDVVVRATLPEIAAADPGFTLLKLLEGLEDFSQKPDTSAQLQDYLVHRNLELGITDYGPAEYKTRSHTLDELEAALAQRFRNWKAYLTLDYSAGDKKSDIIISKKPVFLA